MPRKNPLPPDEAAICQRVKRFRESLGLSLVSFAKTLGVDSTALVNIEHARVPLRFGIAQRLRQNFPVSFRWLAIGKPGDGVAETVAVSAVPKNTLETELFSRVFEEFMSRRVAFSTPDLEEKIQEVVRYSAILGRAEMEGIRWDTLTQMDGALTELLNAALNDESNRRAVAEVVERARELEAEEERGKPASKLPVTRKRRLKAQ